MTDNGNKPATQAGLAEVKTELKADIKAVKADVKGLEKTITRVAMDQARMRGDIHDMEQRITTKIDARHSEIMNAIDAFGRKAEMYDKKALSHGDQLQGHDARLEDHGKRIGALESSPGT